MTELGELCEELREWELMYDELFRADTHDWEKEHDRSKRLEMQWVFKQIQIVKRKIREAT